MSAFLVETNQPGIEREDWVAKMGMPNCNTAMFELRDYPVPAAKADSGNGHRGELVMLCYLTLTSPRAPYTAPAQPVGD